MYKIIQNNKVIDVVKIPRFVRFLASGYIALTDKTSAQGIVGSDDKTIYSFKTRPGSSVVSIQEITLEEFNRLQSLLNSKQEVCADESALAKAKRNKIKCLSEICKAKITSGFSIKLSDGENYNFKLTVEDQLNLMALEAQLTTDSTTFLYHATDMPCRFFSRDDMTKIVSTFRRHTLYHTTYFNVAKQYINSQTNLEKVLLFTYGTDVSNSVSDKVIKQILKNGGNF